MNLNSWLAAAAFAGAVLLAVRLLVAARRRLRTGAQARALDAPLRPASAPGQRLSTEFDDDTRPMRYPMPSTWFDDFDSAPTPLDRGKDEAA